MPKTETNIEFMQRIMDFSSTGGLMQTFILHAVESYSQHVVDNSDKLIEDMKDNVISGEAWVASAEEYLREIKARRGES